MSERITNRNRQTDRQTEGQRETETETETDRDRQTETERQRQRDRQRDRQADRQAGRQEEVGEWGLSKMLLEVYLDFPGVEVLIRLFSSCTCSRHAWRAKKICVY